jgi:homoserine dehydrogenase
LHGARAGWQRPPGALVAVRFEAAVCGAIPIVRTLCEAVPPGAVRRITGVVNGTTNFLLGRMGHGVGLAEALAEARELGYAEADPSEDLSGADAAAKMALLAGVAFARPVALDDVRWHGIQDISPHDLDAARAAGTRIRLIGEAAAVPGSIAVVRVRPTALPENDPLARVPAAFNEVAIDAHALDRLVLRGPGAGGPATATAVVADLLTLASGGADQLGRIATGPTERASGAARLTPSGGRRARRRA